MKNKAITLSFDDGFDYDRRLVKLMNQYGLKGTFNLNSGCFGYENTWQTSNGLVVHHLEKEELRELYRGHEIAAHGLTHGDFPEMSQEELEYEIGQDVKKLHEIFGSEICTLAYPCGKYEERFETVLKKCGIYMGRGAKSSFSTEVSANLYHFPPSLHIPYHFQFPEKMKLVDEFLAASYDMPQILLMYGHSYELEDHDQWDAMEWFFQKISGHSDIFYGTNIEVLRYFQLV